MTTTYSLEEVEMITEKEPINTFSTDGFICPHCGNLYSEPEGLHYTDDRDPEVQCGGCNETYYVSTHIRVSWETVKDEDDL